MTSELTVNDTSAICRTLLRIVERSPRYGAKLNAQFSQYDSQFFQRAETVLLGFEGFLCSPRGRGARIQPTTLTAR